MTISQAERRAILAEDQRIKRELEKANPRLSGSYGILDEWDKGLKQDAAKSRSQTRYRDMYEPVMNFSK